VEIEFHRTGPDDPDAVALAKAMTDEGSRVYADRGRIRAEGLDELLGPEDRVLVGRISGRAVAVGAIRALAPGTGEIKRMYVAPGARGTGVSTAILRRLEHEARALGWDRLVLETGEKQPDAMRFYEREGFTRIPLYGHYVDSAISRCYGKPL